MIRFLDLKKINQSYHAELEQAYKDVLHSGWFVLGKKVEDFEHQFADYVGCRYCIGTGNGLDALTLMLKAHDFDNAAEIIVPANTYIATILSIIHAGLTPILVEPNESTFNLNPAKTEEAITEKTAGIVAVHLYGRVANMKEINTLAEKNNLKVFEDAAQAHGARLDGTMAGNLSNASAFSFYPSKNLGALGDGGAVCTNDEILANKVRSLRNYGSSKKYHNEFLGFNSRLDELQASILSVKLKYLNKENKRRREIADQYLNGISNPKIVLPEKPENEEHVWHLFVVRTDNRVELQQYLLEKGIETQIHYPIPPHKQAGMKDFNHLSFPITEKIHQEVLSLPIGPHLTDIDVKNVISALQSYSS